MFRSRSRGEHDDGNYSGRQEARATRITASRSTCFDDRAVNNRPTATVDRITSEIGERTDFDAARPDCATGFRG